MFFSSLCACNYTPNGVQLQQLHPKRGVLQAEGVPSASVHPEPVAELIWGENVFRVTEKNSERRYSEKSASPDSNSVPSTPARNNTRCDLFVKMSEGYLVLLAADDHRVTQQFH